METISTKAIFPVPHGEAGSEADAMAALPNLSREQIENIVTAAKRLTHGQVRFVQSTTDVSVLLSPLLAVVLALGAAGGFNVEPVERAAALVSAAIGISVSIMQKWADAQKAANAAAVREAIENRDFSNLLPEQIVLVVVMVAHFAASAGDLQL
ncbi:MAG: hypothetical protein LBI39_02315 [Puniceicoccales bacterium]|jgi:hypothetical protein|nr:hypothetical protein [Puniceicoccales bacterium]